MGMRLVWSSLGGGVVGFLVCAFIVYPPHSGWNESLDLPAWVQAVGSVFAIIGAAAFPAFHERLKLRSTRVQSLAELKALSSVLQYEVGQLHEIYKDTASLVGVNEFGDMDKFLPLVQTINELPTTGAVSKDHLLALLEIRRLASQASFYWRSAVKKGPEMFEHYDADEDVGALKKSVDLMVADVLKLRPE